MTARFSVMTETHRRRRPKSGASTPGLGDPNGILPFPHVTGYWVNRLASAFRTVVERAEATGEGAPTASDLTRELGVDSTAVTRMVDRLEEKGLLERTPDPNDGRRLLIHLTPATDTLLPQIKGIARRIEARFETDISAKDLHAFQRVILRMLENAGESLGASLLHD